MKKAKSGAADELRPEYRREDLGNGVRGKYFAAYQKGSNLVLLIPILPKRCRPQKRLTKRSAASCILPSKPRS